MNAHVEVVILAGGQGTRFWPMSRQKKPKQFLALTRSGQSLLTLTAKRVFSISGKDRLTIVTNQHHQELTKQHVPYAQVLCEPLARNTAASIAFSALVLSKLHGDAIMVVLPADQSVKNEAELLRLIQLGIETASTHAVLVTIGIKPTSAHTGYGYIKSGDALGPQSNRVERFFEKPSRERAEQYLSAGTYFWNSGMFIWKVSTILKAFENHMPKLYAALQTLEQAWGTPRQDQALNKYFADCESISIDFGVLEHARNCAVLSSSDLGWSDVGSWDAWAEYFQPDAEGNLLHGDALALDCEGCVANSQNRLIAMVGMKNCVVIETQDALLICPRDQVQDVRRIVEELKKRGRDELV